MALTDTVRRLDEALHRLPPPYGPLSLPDPVPPARPLDDIPPGYAEFLRLADGATCGTAGEIRLWSAASVRQQRAIADGLPGGADAWCPIGDVLQNPVCMNRGTGEVWWFGNLDIVWYTDTTLESFTRATGDVETFLDTFVLGAGYRRLVGAGPDDPWLLAIAG